MTPAPGRQGQEDDSKFKAIWCIQEAPASKTKQEHDSCTDGKPMASKGLKCPGQRVQNRT